jgi:small-conductance mechanosensitive channel
MDQNEPSLATRVLRDLDPWLLLEIALVILASTAAVILIERATVFLTERASARFRRPLAMAGPLSRLVIIVLALMTVVGMLIKPTPENLVALFGAVALAVGFALKDYVSSLFAGVDALIERLYRRHDWITIGDDYGKVRELGFRAVQIVTLDDTVVTIPHSRLWTENVKYANDGKQTLMSVADFYLHPDHDAQAARDRLRDVALTSAYLALDRPVTVIVHEQPWATHYRLKAYPIEADDQLLFTSDLTVRGKKELMVLGCRFAGALAALGADG